MQYQIYLLSDDGQVIASVGVDCEDDAAAIEAAQNHRGPPLEIWTDPLRLVASVPAARTPWIVRQEEAEA